MEKLSSWFQVIGNVGLLVGLIFVGFQIQQDRELKRAEFVYLNLQGVSDSWLAVMGEDPAASLERLAFRPDEITERDLIVLEAWFRLDQTNWKINTLLEEYGFFEGQWRKNPDLHESWGSEIGRRVLSEIYLDSVHPEFREWLTEERTKLSPSEYGDYFRSIKGDLTR